jgi:hypothetical protein
MHPQNSPTLFHIESLVARYPEFTWNELYLGSVPLEKARPAKFVPLNNPPAGVTDDRPPFRSLRDSSGIGSSHWCASVYLHHPETGKTVNCGPYVEDPASDHSAMLLKRACIEDYERQGYDQTSGG